MNINNVLFCGGDRRFLSTAREFINCGYNCKSYFCDFSHPDIEKITKIPYEKGIVILPLPSFIDDKYLNGKNDISPEFVFSSLKPETPVFGGMISEFIFRLAREYNLSVYDYAAREEFSVKNSIPTAEAAIFIASERLKRTVFGSKIDVVGYGRIGKALAKRLSALGAKVKIAARSRAALSLAECNGFTVENLSEYLNHSVDCDVLFNTVPCRIINKKTTDNDNTVFIDLASKPGGFTEDAEKTLGTRLIKALALPGKYSPESAGEIIFETVNNIIKEIGE